MKRSFVAVIVNKVEHAAVMLVLKVAARSVHAAG